MGNKGSVCLNNDTGEVIKIRVFEGSSATLEALNVHADNPKKEISLQPGKTQIDDPEQFRKNHGNTDLVPILIICYNGKCLSGLKAQDLIDNKTITVKQKDPNLPGIGLIVRMEPWKPKQNDGPMEFELQSLEPATKGNTTAQLDGRDASLELRAQLDGRDAGNGGPNLPPAGPDQAGPPVLASADPADQAQGSGINPPTSQPQPQPQPQPAKLEAQKEEHHTVDIPSDFVPPP